MKKIMYPMLALLILVGSAFNIVHFQEWKIADDFSIKFTSKDPSGIFKEFKGSIIFDESMVMNAKFDLSIPIESISMGNGMKNKKSLTPEWFDAGKHPNITFKSTSVEKSGKGYLIVGDLKIKGITKQYKIPADFAKAGESGKFTGTFNVNRSDFKIGKPSGVVPDLMKVEFIVPVFKK